MKMDDSLRDLILKHASTNVVREEAKKRGMRSLRDSGLLAVFDGVTTIEEVVKATAVEQ
jgi:type IV pilus assembly protein PilB